jgi:dephospho-CoA kinase
MGIVHIHRKIKLSAFLVVQPGKKAYKRIREAFGDEFFDDENGGELKRQKLGNFIFGNVEVFSL